MKQNASGGLRFVATRLMVATCPKLGMRICVRTWPYASMNNFQVLRICLLSLQLIQGTQQLPLVSLTNHMVNCEFRVAPWRLVRAIEIQGHPGYRELGQPICIHLPISPVACTLSSYVQDSTYYMDSALLVECWLQKLIRLVLISSQLWAHQATFRYDAPKH